MGCGRIVTTDDIRMIRAARHEVQSIRAARHELHSGLQLVAMGFTGVGLKIARNGIAKVNTAIGDIGEHATQQSMRGHNLNVTVKKNSAIYDVASTSGVASVKTYGVSEKTPSSTTVSNYLEALRVATGCSQKIDNQSKFGCAAEDLHQAAKQGVQLPAELKNASNGTQAANWLRNNAELRIPNDHVHGVKKAVPGAVIRNPAAYGLSSKATYAEKVAFGQKLADRVKPMGVTTEEIIRDIGSKL